MAEALGPAAISDGEIRAAEVVPHYFGAYEEAFELGVLRPVTVTSVAREDGGYRVESSAGTFHAEGLLSATGTWDRPYVPSYPGIESFRGRQLHTHDYRRPEPFAGQRVLVVGGGISAVDLLTELSAVAETTWVTRTPVTFLRVAFTPEIGREAVARVEDRVRRGLRPGSVVSVTGLPWNPRWDAGAARGALERRPMMRRIDPHGITWPDGSSAAIDTIVWCTGFRPDLGHLRGLGLRGPAGGIRMDGQLATRVADEPRLHLPGYGPSASTIGANRAGRAAVRELRAALA